MSTANSTVSEPVSHATEADAPRAPKGSAYARLFETLAAADAGYEGSIYKGDGTPGGLFHCPVHDDDNASLEVHEGRNGKPLLSCPPCEAMVGHEAFMDALRDIRVEWDGRAVKQQGKVDWGSRRARVSGSGPSSRGVPLAATHRMAARYDYRLADGRPNFNVVRWEPGPNAPADARKVFLPKHGVPGEGIVKGLEGVERTPYHLDRFDEWADSPLYVVEGEKATEAVVNDDRHATTFHGGAKQALPDGWVSRYGFDRFPAIRLWPDFDAPGLAWMQRIAADLDAAGLGDRIEWWADLDAEAKDDAWDVLRRHRKPERLGRGTDIPEALKEAVERAGGGSTTVNLKGGAAVSAPCKSGSNSTGRTTPAGGKELVAVGVEKMTQAEIDEIIAEAEAEFAAGHLLGDPETEAGLTPDDIRDLYSAPGIADEDDLLDTDDERDEFKDGRLAHYLAREFEREGHPVLFTSGLGWLAWNGKRWKPTDRNAVRGLIIDYALGWLRDHSGDRSVPRDRLAKVSALLTNSRAQSVVGAMEAVIRAEASDFDAEPDLLNCQNGVVDLRTGELRPHDPALRLTKITKVAYLPERRGKSKDWRKAKRALPADVGEFLMRRLGQAITGHTPTDDRIVFNVGVGGNGKSTLLEPVRRCLGDYAGVVPQKLILANPNDHPTELMTLRGLRLALVEELPETSRVNTQRLKDIAGTGAITARLMRQDFVTFAPSHSLFINTNHEPTIAETDHGTWRRLIEVPFTRRFRREDGSVDETLRQRVKRRAAQEAVLADLVHYAGLWYAEGRIMHPEPETIEAATSEWRSHSDRLLAFFNERLEPDPAGAISMTTLLREYNRWVEDERGGQHLSKETLTARLRANEALPVRFCSGRSRNAVGTDGRREPNSNPVFVWKGVRFQR